MTVTLEIDTDRLRDVNAQILAAYWHAVQASPAPYGDPETERGAEHIGREIIRRWLADVGPDLWTRQGSHVEYAERLQGDDQILHVIEAARAAVKVDFGSNLVSDREAQTQAIWLLQTAVAGLKRK